MKEFQARVKEIQARKVTLVVPDETRRAALRAWLEGRGWSVHAESDGRHALRCWSEHPSPILFIDLDEDDVDAFELLAGVAAHAIAPKVAVSARGDLAEALRPLGVEQVLAPHCRFGEIETALEAIRSGSVTRAA